MTPIPYGPLSHRARGQLDALLRGHFQRGKLRVEPIPKDVLSLIESRTPRGSAWDTLLRLGHGESLGLGLLASPDLPLVGETHVALSILEGLPTPSPVVVAMTQGYFDLLSVEDLASHITFLFALHLLPPHAQLSPRAIAADRAEALWDPYGLRLGAEENHAIEAARQKGEWRTLLRMLDAWDPGEDPDGLLRAPLNHALSVILPSVSLVDVIAARLLRPYFRACLEIPSLERQLRCGDVLQAFGEAVHVQGDLQGLGLFAAPRGDGAVPLPDLTLPLSDWGFEPLGEASGLEGLSRWVAAQLLHVSERPGAAVVGIIAPGGAGKTTLSQALKGRLEARGLRVAYLGADAYLWPGDGFRYRQRGPERDTWLRGPGMYLSEALGADLACLRAGGCIEVPGDPKAKLEPRQVGPVDVVLTEGVFMGLDHRVRQSLDVILGLTVNVETQAPRFEAKFRRDMASDSVRRINIHRDFAEKIFQETEDGIFPVLKAFAQGIYCRESGELWVRERE